MDEEQIWQQLELENSSFLSSNLIKASKLLSYQDEKLLLDYHIAGESENESESNVNEDEDENDFDDPNESNELENLENSDNENQFNNDDNNMDDMDENDMDDDNNERSMPKSIVDDEFFKLYELKKFLDDEDRKENKKQKGLNVDDDEDVDEENDINLFNDIESDGDEEDIGTTAKFSDFFGTGKDSKINELLKEREKRHKMRRKLRKDDLGEDDSEVDEQEMEIEENEEIENYEENNDGEEEEEDDENNPKSSFEVREQRLKSRIEKMENQALGEKSWQLRGEITNKNRPINSLLEEVLDFDSSVRPAPVVTEETTVKLEDIIKQRIRDKAYDDVERKIKPADTPQEYRKKLILEQEKSKDSLVKIYENEYMKQIDAATLSTENTIKEIPKEHQEITKLMKSVMSKLNALSNFHYTPKPAAPEFRIITNTPAIEMEEIIPVGISDANALAPEEIRKKPKGIILGKDERTKTDKKREKRQKKIKQKYIHKIQEDTEKNKKNTSDDKEKLLKKLTKHRNIEKVSYYFIIIYFFINKCISYFSEFYFN